jgi:hypothetical protein
LRAFAPIETPSVLAEAAGTITSAFRHLSDTVVNSIVPFRFLRGRCVTR